MQLAAIAHCHTTHRAQQSCCMHQAYAPTCSCSISSPLELSTSHVVFNCLVTCLLPDPAPHTLHMHKRCSAYLQDLSPILPGPTVTDLGQLGLRRAVLECIAVLAQHVGDSLHLLEAMGGIVGKLPGPSPLSTAVLDCVVAASGAVNSFSPKVSCQQSLPLVFCSLARMCLC